MYKPTYVKNVLNMFNMCGYFSCLCYNCLFIRLEIMCFYVCFVCFSLSVFRSLGNLEEKKLEKIDCARLW